LPHDEREPGQVSFLDHLRRVYAIFVPFHAMGMVGMPRRYAQFGEYEFLKNTHPLVMFVTVAAIITAAVQLVFYFQLFLEHVQGPEAGNNPWEATTLEWNIPSPPPHDNFAGVVPEVYRDHTSFGSRRAEDFMMQTEPEGAEVAASLGEEAAMRNGHSTDRVIDTTVGARPRRGNGFRRTAADDATRVATLFASQPIDIVSRLGSHRQHSDALVALASSYMCARLRE